MKIQTTILALLLLFTIAESKAIDPSVADRPAPSASKIFIEPSSASLAGGKVNLTASALNREAESFVGNYRLKVTPYFFKNEDGTITITVPDSSLRKLTKGSAMEFSGRAKTNGSSKTRPIKVKATCLGTGRGDLTISILTENGDLVFNTSYRFGDS